MSTHNLCFRAKIRKIMYTPVNPRGVMGCKLHGLVILMTTLYLYLLVINVQLKPHFLHAPNVDYDETLEVANADLRLRWALKLLHVHSFCQAAANI